MTKILIAEDDIQIADLYDRKFEKSGFDVILAGNGEEAVKRAKKESPDIILLDVMMPIMNGFEALKELKKLPETKEIPIIIVSNYGELPNVTAGLNFGAEDYLIKVEHTPEETVEIVKDILEKKTPIIKRAFED